MAVNLSFIGGAGWQFFDDNGNPLSGGKIYTYATSTTTPQPTYTSRTGLTPNANPIILDAAGRTPEQIWSIEGLLYKYVIADANDVVIRTWDGIGGSLVASDLTQDLANTTDNTKGDALVGFKQSNAVGFLNGAIAKTVNAKLQEIISVKDFGATGNGSTDDTTAIQSALNYIGTNGGTLLFPHGTYRITSMLSLIYTPGIFWKLTSDKAQIYVDSASKIEAALKIKVNGNISLTRTQVEIQEFTIKGNNKAYTGLLIDSDALGNSCVISTKQIYIDGCDVGLDIVACMESNFYDTVLFSNVINLRLRQDPIGGGANANSFFGTRITNGSVGVVIHKTSPYVLHNNQFFGLLCQGLTKAGVVSISANNIEINGAHFENSITPGTSYTIDLGTFGNPNLVSIITNGVSLYSSDFSFYSCQGINNIGCYTTNTIIGGGTTEKCLVGLFSTYLNDGVTGSCESLQLNNVSIDAGFFNAEYIVKNLQFFYRSSILNKLTNWKSNNVPAFVNLTNTTGVIAAATKTTGSDSFLGATDIVQYAASAGSFSSNGYYFGVTNTSGAINDVLVFTVIFKSSIDTNLGCTVSGTQALSSNQSINIKAGIWYMYCVSGIPLTTVNGGYSAVIYPTGTDNPLVTFAKPYITRVSNPYVAAQVCNNEIV